MESVTKQKRVSKEAYAYTPGLKVKRAMTVSKMRRLPMPGEVLVKVGDKVDYNTVVARTLVSGDPGMVNVANLLTVEPRVMPMYMTKKVGDQVTKGEIIASYRALFGLIKKQVRSTIDGTIESISDVTGQVIIRGPPKRVEVDAYIPGQITDVFPREGAIIQTNGVFIQGIFGIGGENHGRIKAVVNSPDEELTADKITAEDKGAVLIGGSRVTLEALNKGAEVGAACIVAGGVHYKDITIFRGVEVGVAITGEENTSLTTIITEGFGKMSMPQRTFELLKRFQGYTASVNGTTQIRAGVIRPEIIIHHDESFEDASKDELVSGMVQGMLVRIIKQPDFGEIGKIVGLPVELEKVDSESSVRILEVQLDNGTVTKVPRANVEIIEE